MDRITILLDIIGLITTQTMLVIKSHNGEVLYSGYPQYYECDPYTEIMSISAKNNILEVMLYEED